MKDIKEFNKINIKSIMDIKEISKKYDESRNDYKNLLNFIPHKHPFMVTNKEILDYLTHNKKVIDRLSRKIQRLKRDIRVSDGWKLHYKLLTCSAFTGVRYTRKNQDLQQRIDKAIEFIDDRRFDLELPSVQEELLEILGGKDEE